MIYGAGPVGLMAAYSAQLKGASQIMVVDRLPDRLKLVQWAGAIPIDDSKGDHIEQILELTKGEGADKGCECVGYQAHDPRGHEHPNMTMNDLVKSVRATGVLGVVGYSCRKIRKDRTSSPSTGRSPSTSESSGARG